MTGMLSLFLNEEFQKLLTELEKYMGIKGVSIIII